MRDMPRSGGFTIISPDAEGYKKAERMRTTMHSSEYFGYLKDHEMALYKYQLRKEKYESKVQYDRRSMIDDEELMARDVKVL